MCDPISYSCGPFTIAASLSTLATYLKGSAPGAIADALERGTFQQLLDLRRTLHLSNATIGYLQAFVQSSRNPTKVCLVLPSPGWPQCRCYLLLTYPMNHVLFIRSYVN